MYMFIWSSLSFIPPDVHKFIRTLQTSLPSWPSRLLQLHCTESASPNFGSFFQREFGKENWEGFSFSTIAHAESKSVWGKVFANSEKMKYLKSFYRHRDLFQREQIWKTVSLSRPKLVGSAVLIPHSNFFYQTGPFWT